MAKLHLTDPLYGEIDITEPVLIALMQSQPLQRLEGINQHGPLEYSQPRLGRISRRDHSIGVMLLLRRHGADVAQQAAGLLHDVAHTAFSHVVDYALGSAREQNFHETVVQKILGNSDIPDILQRHGFDPDYITTPKNFPLLEQNEPALCADRLDYVLRDSLVAFYLLDAGQVANHLDHLRVHDNEWIFDDQISARQFGLDMLQCAEQGWYTAMNRAAFDTLGEAMKHALTTGLITQQDLFTTDSEFYHKLRACNDQTINRLLYRLEHLRLDANPKTDAARQWPKLRVADPRFFRDGRLVRLSEVDEPFRARLQEHTDWLRAGLPIAFLD